MDSGQVAESPEAKDESEAEEDAKGAENDVDEQGHGSDPFKIDKSRYTQGCPVVCNHPPAPTWDRTE